MPIATRLTNAGTLLVNGSFDENTSFSLVADALVVGGGGAGGHLGGGGAGGHRYFVDQSLVANTNYTVTVGAGGTASAGATGNQGSNSVFDTYTSAGGGGGAGEAALPAAGGSGGGGGGIVGSRSGAAGNTPSTSPSQGNTGGNGNDNGAGTAFAGGGGGGAGGTGNNASGTTTAGNGGLGTANSITGTSVTRAAGGGGGAYQLYGTGTAGTGGSSIGGNGGRNGLNATSGSSNTGSGGGGNGYTSDGNLQGVSGAGGSGVVILKYPNTFTISNSGGGLTFTTDSSSVAGYNITTFTAGTGQISFTALTKFRTTSTTVYAGELDEVTISGGAVAKREINTGVLQVKNIFDEFTGAPVVDTNLMAWVDAGQTTSYSGSGATWTDLSGNGKTYTLSNSPTFSSLTGGGVITFAGASSQYATTAATLFNSTTTNTYSINIWVYPTGAGQIVSVDGQSTPNTGYHYTALEITAAGLIYFGQWTGTNSVIATSSQSLNTWYNLAITYNGTTATAYVNGTSVGSSAIIWSAPGANTFFALMSQDSTNMSATTAYASGSIGAFMVYNRALTADEVTTNFNALRNRYGI